MSKMEQAVITGIISLALTAIALSYCAKTFPDMGRTVSGAQDREADRACMLLAKRTSVNINTADRYTLTRLPGIGPAIAQRVVDFRKARGFFNSPECLMLVKGIGPAKFKLIKNSIRTYD